MTDIASLSANSDWWEGIGELAAIIVLVGVIGEGLAEFSPNWLKMRTDMKALGRTGWRLCRT
jgi:hypothetical protein